jgi:CheY-like chemotaxis protein
VTSPATYVDLLLIEDNPSDAELTIRALKKQHLAINITVIDNGADALDYFFPSETVRIVARPRLILLDLKLPLVGGLEVLKRLKSDEKTRTIPVIILTSSHEDRDLEECYRLGANSYVVKPVQFKDFMEVVSKLGFYWQLLNETPAGVVVSSGFDS